MEVGFKNMSNLSRNYNHNSKDGVGVLTITGLPLEESPYYAPLGKLYSSCRKRIDEQYGVQVTGIFMYDYPTRGIITCNFHPNCYNCNNEDAKIKKVLQRFEDTFELQIALFCNVIECFMDDQENGYQTYLKHLEHIHEVAKKDYPSEEERKLAISKATAECDEMFDVFLLSIGVKTDKDLEKRQKKQTTLEKAKKELEKLGIKF